MLDFSTVFNAIKEERSFTYVTVFILDVKETEISFLCPGYDVFWLPVFA